MIEEHVTRCKSHLSGPETDDFHDINASVSIAQESELRQASLMSPLEKQRFRNITTPPHYSPFNSVTSPCSSRRTANRLPYKTLPWTEETNLP